MAAVSWLAAQTSRPNDAALRRLERQLTAVLRWGILWGNLPAGFRVTGDGSARLAIHRTPNLFSFCSPDLGTCAEYAMEGRKIGQRNRSVPCVSGKPPCSQGMNDIESVLAFAGANRQAPAAQKTTERPLFGGTISGTLGSPGAIIWTATIKLDNRAETLKYYQQLRPAELDGLREWLRTHLRGAGYKSVTIPCFASSDPKIYVYGDRPERGPIVFSVFWDEESEEWVEAGRLDRMEDRAQIDKLKSLIEPIACSTIRFD
ncbi:MAG TPA: hypothetical protein VLE22_11095 [Bryobacteraceae bacterium]|nr:hypothetical protein [Bryobacteraceae bacterium]